MSGTAENILEINGIEVMYDSVISALHDVSLSVETVSYTHLRAHET